MMLFLQIWSQQMRLFSAPVLCSGLQALHRTVERDLALIIFMHALLMLQTLLGTDAGSLGTVLVDILRALGAVHQHHHIGRRHLGNALAGKEVVVVKCGVGKVNAAICAQILVSVFGVSALVNTGVAGSLNNDINICDIVVSTSALEHDMDVTPLGYAKGVIPDMDQSEFKADENLIKLAKDSAEEAGLDVKIFATML